MLRAGGHLNCRVLACLYGMMGKPRVAMRARVPEGFFFWCVWQVQGLERMVCAGFMKACAHDLERRFNVKSTPSSLHALEEPSKVL